MIRRVGALLIIVLLVSGAIAQEKAIDPDKDQRLKQKVSLRVPSIPLHNLMRQLSTTTGVSLRADDTIREHRLVIYAPDQPLHLVMTHIAQAFGYQWKRIDYEDGPPTYRLVDPEPQRAKQPDWEWLRKEFVPRVCQEFQKPIEARLERLSRLKQSPNDVDLDDIDGVLAFTMSVERNFPAYRALCLLDDRGWARLQNGEMLFFNTRDGSFPTEATHEWKTLVERELTSIDFAKAGFEGESEALRRGLEATIQWVQSAVEMRVWLWYDPHQKELLGWYSVFDSDGRNVRDFVAVWNNSNHYEPILSQRFSLKEETPKSRANVSFPTHPAYDRKLERYRPPNLHSDWFSWLGELMIQMAEVSNICLVSEYYPLDVLTMGVEGEQSLTDRPISWSLLYEILRKNWYHASLSESGWLVVSHRMRNPARLEDIPQATVERWFYKPNYRGILTLEDYAELSNRDTSRLYTLYLFLTRYIEAYDIPSEDYFILDTDYLHGGVLFAQSSLATLSQSSQPYCELEQDDLNKLLEVRHALNLYASLTPTQRAILRRGGEIAFNELNYTQQVSFLRAVSDGNIVTLNELWHPIEQRQQVFQTARLRLVSRTCERDGYRLRPSERERIKTIKDWLENRATIETESVRVRHRVWRFEFLWNDRMYTAEIVMPYPIEREPK